MLNGADEFTDKEANNYCSSASSDVNKSASIYTVDNCLFATFPQELQDAIGKRQVKYDSVYDNKTEKNLKTINDKLWLFSPNELADMISNGSYTHPLECNKKDFPYEKFKGTRDGCDVNAVRRPFCVNSLNGNATGDTIWAWLRSSDGNYDNYALYLNYKGRVINSPADGSYGVSVGFTLER